MHLQLRSILIHPQIKQCTRKKVVQDCNERVNDILGIIASIIHPSFNLPAKTVISLLCYSLETLQVKVKGVDWTNLLRETLHQLQKSHTVNQSKRLSIDAE